MLGLVEAVRMQQLTGRCDILYSIVETLDHVCIKKPNIESDDIGHAISTTCAEFGDFLRQIDSTMKDGRVTKNELKKVQKELAEMIAAANSLHALVASKIKG